MLLPPNCNIRHRTFRYLTPHLSLTSIGDERLAKCFTFMLKRDDFSQREFVQLANGKQDGGKKFCEIDSEHALTSEAMKRVVVSLANEILWQFVCAICLYETRNSFLLSSQQT